MSKKRREEILKVYLMNNKEKKFKRKRSINNISSINRCNEIHNWIYVIKPENILFDENNKI